MKPLERRSYPQWDIPPLVLPKPRWWSRNEADANAMVAWVFERLEVRRIERINRLAYELAEHGNTFDFETGLSTPVYSYKAAIEAAQAGNVEPLREAARKAGLPELAEFISPPKLKPGEYQRVRNFRLDDAVEDVRYIREELWPQEFNFKRRSRDNPPTAEDIAAAFHNVDVEEVISQLRHQ
jgi:hypothetical protein